MGLEAPSSPPDRTPTVRQIAAHCTIPPFGMQEWRIYDFSIYD